MNDNLKFLEQIDAQEDYPWVDDEGKEHPGFIRYYSQNGKKIRNVQTGELYDEAVEIYPCKTKYYETDINLEPDSEASENEIQKNKETGGENDEE